MRPATGAFLEKAREFLQKSQDALEGGKWADEAGRAAYLAGFHAAQALIFEAADRVVKTHRGVQAEFLRLTKGDAAFDIDLRAFLGRSYNLKAIADYETGPGSEVSHESAAEALATARRFVDTVAQRLS